MLLYNLAKCYNQTISVDQICVWSPPLLVDIMDPAKAIRNKHSWDFENK